MPGLLHWNFAHATLLPENTFFNHVNKFDISINQIYEDLDLLKQLDPTLESQYLYIAILALFQYQCEYIDTLEEEELQDLLESKSCKEIREDDIDLLFPFKMEEVVDNIKWLAALKDIGLLGYQPTKSISLKLADHYKLNLKNGRGRCGMHEHFHIYTNEVLVHKFKKDHIKIVCEEILKRMDDKYKPYMIIPEKVMFEKNKLFDSLHVKCALYSRDIETEFVNSNSKMNFQQEVKIRHVTKYNEALPMFTKTEKLYYLDRLEECEECAHNVFQIIQKENLDLVIKQNIGCLEDEDHLEKREIIENFNTALDYILPKKNIIENFNIAMNYILP